MSSEDSNQLEKAVGVSFRKYDDPPNRRNIGRWTLALASGLLGSLLLANGCSQHVYKTLVSAQEENCGRAHAVKYAYDAIRELHEEVPPDVREVRFVAVENYLIDYVKE